MELERLVSQTGKTPKRKDVSKTSSSVISPAYSSEDETERMFSRAQYEEIMTGAENLRARKQATQTIQDKISKEILNGNDVPLSRIYRLADDLEIGRENVDAYLATRYPSEKEQARDLKKYGAEMTSKAKTKMETSLIIGGLEEALASFFPQEEYSIVKAKFPVRYNFYHNETKFKRSWFLKRSKKEICRKLMASIGDTSDCGLWTVNIHDPCFLKVCGPALNRSKTMIDDDERSFEIFCDYPVKKE